jgi:hypothetical protein
MKLQSTKVEIFNINSEKELASFVNLVDVAGPSIQDWLNIDNHYIVIRDNVLDLYNEDVDHYHGLDVNVAISSAITAGGDVYS